MATRQPKASRDPGAIRTALRVVEIIEIYAREGRSLTLTELSKLLDAPMSSCLGLIRTLVTMGYLYETGRRQGYYPTGRLLNMARRIARNDPVLERVRPHMESLRDATGETAVFGQMQADGRVIYLDVQESPNPVRYIAAPGELRDPQYNSIGRAILGISDDERRDRILQTQSFAPRTEHSIDSREAFGTALRKWRAQGWYPNLGESQADLGAVAVPVTIAGRVYGLSVAGPVHRVRPRVREFAAALKAMQAEVADAADA
jgi:DNA-binding IclR family transcriptional regulator